MPQCDIQVCHLTLPYAVTVCALSALVCFWTGAVKLCLFALRLDLSTCDASQGSFMTACVVHTRAGVHALSNLYGSACIEHVKLHYTTNYTAQAKQRYQTNSSIAARCHSVVLFHHLECDLAAEL